MANAQKEFNIHIKSRLTEFLAPAMIMLVDYVMVVMAELLAYYLRGCVFDEFGVLNVDAIYLYIIMPFVFLFFLHIKTESVLGRPFWQTARKSFWDVIYAVVAISVITYLEHDISTSVSRFFLLSSGVFSVFTIVSGRYFVRKIMGTYKMFQIPIVIIGAGRTAEILIRSFSGDVGFGYRIIGFIDDNPVSASIANRFRILGGFSQADRIIRRTGVHHVIIAAPGLDQKEQVELVNRIQPYVKSVSFVPDLLGSPGNLEIVSIADSGLMLIKVKNNLANWYNRFTKRVFDIICVTIGLPMVLPVLLVIAIAIYMEDGGPVLYSKPRLGYNNKEFICYKFRSMYNNCDEAFKNYLANNPEAREEWETYAKLKKYDPRVTRVGKFIRKYSLDELPQLLNVIIGNMSLVGPRPYLPSERKRMGEKCSTILATVPGITGLWQTSGRNEVSFEERVAMDSWYVHNWSVWMDMWYLIKTVKVVLLRKGAY